MGLRMDDIHNPTVPSGPTSSHSASDGPRDGASLAELIAAKEKIEGELTALSQVLESVRVLKLHGDKLLNRVAAQGQHAHQSYNLRWVPTR